MQIERTDSSRFSRSSERPFDKIINKVLSPVLIHHQAVLLKGNSGLLLVQSPSLKIINLRAKELLSKLKPQQWLRFIIWLNQRFVNYQWQPSARRLLAILLGALRMQRN